MCGADCWTYYKLIVAKLTLQIQQKRRPHEKYLSNNCNFTNFDPNDSEINSASMNKVVHSASKIHLGKATGSTLMVHLNYWTIRTISRR